MLIELLTAVVMLQTGAPEAETVPPLVTIAEIHEDPWAWDGRRVRVVGDMDHCVGYDCNICDEIEYYPGSEQSMDQAHDSGSCAGIFFRLRRTGDDIVRFNRVMVDAEYSAHCSGVRNPGADLTDPDADVISICTDRASELRDTIVLDILEERPATSLSWPEDEYIVIPAPPELGEPLIEAFWGALPWSDEEERTSTEVFAFIDVVAAQNPSANHGYGVCACQFSEDCDEADWPNRSIHLFPARGNPYTCSFAVQRDDSSWVFPLQ